MYPPDDKPETVVSEILYGPSGLVLAETTANTVRKTAIKKFIF